MIKGLQLTTPPASEPITLADAKNYLKVDSADTSDDALVTQLIAAARQSVEAYTDRALINQTWTFWLDRFPAGPKGRDQWWDGVREGSISQLTGAWGFINIPKSPLVSITTLTTYGMNDVGTDYDLTNLNTDTAPVPGRIFLKVGSTWPVDLRPYSSIKIVFVAGYGTTASAVPAGFSQAMYYLMGQFYENRTPLVEGRGLELPLSVRMLLDPLKVRKL